MTWVLDILLIYNDMYVRRSYYSPFAISPSLEIPLIDFYRHLESSMIRVHAKFFLIESYEEK